ncbi:class I SAM-dependent methyltransferase [Thioclava sp.]|uniref:class I SAM-dependent methyltransferase n=1 Tax=Thioclava sp. TaxID=1933450 RepID=UPI003AA82A2D
MSLSHTCRHCAAPLTERFLDLGHAPLSNAYLDAAGLQAAEVTYPLRLNVCSVCRLVQTEDYTSAADVFGADYAYFSSTSSGWVAHAKRYTDMIIDRLGLGAESLVIEVAANDGYLLQHMKAAGVPCLGVEPTTATADAARAKGIEIVEDFFGLTLAESLVAGGKSADLILGNNVYAHVPDINDFTQAIATALKPEGILTLEFPHLMRLVEHRQFDTVYHEHFSYLSLLTVQRIFEANGLRVVDVEELSTHGGSLRVYGCRSAASHVAADAVDIILAQERARGMDTPDFYKGFQSEAEAVKDAAVRFLLDAKRDGQTVVGYGAAAKGNTLMNFAGIRPDLLPRVHDAAPAKQNMFLPGSHIPIFAPSALDDTRPDYIVILPWNIADEVREQLSYLAKAGTRFVTFVPELKIV